MSYLSVYQNTIEEFENHIQDHFNPSDEMTALIEEGMLYSLEAGGKRIRPLLLLEFATAFGASFEEAYPFALAIEMIHTYSLIHDDLPCMDDDDLRRGKPTNHIKFGYDMAVLAGDALLNRAAEMMTDAILKDPAPHKIRAMKAILDASGTKGMILGQVADMKMQSKTLTLSDLDYINAHKTGKLLTAAMVAGAYVGKADSKTIGHIETIGYEMGLLFQVVDDLLDMTGDVAKLGKKTQIDIKNDKNTYPMILGLDKTKDRVIEMRDGLLEKVIDLDIDTTFLRETIKFLSERDY